MVLVMGGSCYISGRSQSPWARSSIRATCHVTFFSSFDIVRDFGYTLSPFWRSIISTFKIAKGAKTRHGRFKAKSGTGKLIHLPQEHDILHTHLHKTPPSTHAMDRRHIHQLLMTITSTCAS